MNKMLRSFVNENQGQDLVEYTLLLAMVCLVSAALMINGGGSITGIWTAANSRLAEGNSTAAS